MRILKKEKSYTVRRVMECLIRKCFQNEPRRIGEFWWRDFISRGNPMSKQIKVGIKKRLQGTAINIIN